MGPVLGAGGLRFLYFTAVPHSYGERFADLLLKALASLAEIRGARHHHPVREHRPGNGHRMANPPTHPPRIALLGTTVTPPEKPWGTR